VINGDTAYQTEGRGVVTKEKVPATAAVRVLRQEGVQFVPHFYAFVEKGGTSHPAKELHVDEHQVIKTLVFEDETKNPFIVLMHGDMNVSTKALSRILGVRNVTPCTPETATRHSGYLVGGTSPFGTRKKMPVYVEETILGLTAIYINGGKRGFLVEISPEDVRKLLIPVPVKVGIRG
jgi:Cys-tRNA(Pro) deacylase